MTYLINRWIVEDRDAGSSRSFDATNDPTAEQQARHYQWQLARGGHRSQLSHERHILLREPVRFLAPEHVTHATERPDLAPALTLLDPDRERA